MFVPILFERRAHTKVMIRLRAGSNEVRRWCRRMTTQPDGGSEIATDAKRRGCPIIYSGLGSSITPAGTCSEHKEEKLEH